jgi:hypothetical protein
MAILPPTIAGPPPASSPGAPSRPISSRWRLPSHRSTVTALLRPNQSLILHRPGHHSRRRDSTPPPSPPASNPHRAALLSRLPRPPRFRALALLGRLPTREPNHLRQRAGVRETCTGAVLPPSGCNRNQTFRRELIRSINTPKRQLETTCKKTRTAAVVRMAVTVIDGSSALGARLRPPWGELTGGEALRMFLAMPAQRNLDARRRA